jgi:hypothetical protein
VQVKKLLTECNSQRSIVRLTGISRMMLAKLAKKWRKRPRCCAYCHSA